LIATHDNAEKNQVSDKIEAMLPKDFPQAQAEVMMANILAGPLTELAPLFARLTAANGFIVLSGVIESQQDEIIQAYQDDFDISLYLQQEQWICLSGRRKA
jgi:ribosomal protein L11 methyltransferase